MRHGTTSLLCSDCAEEKAYDKGIAEGRRLATAAIVADLRAMAEKSRVGASPVAGALRAMADRYERGEHESQTLQQAVAEFREGT
jgi:hypothetical protein